MQCPRCTRKLTESDWLLCSVPGGHYCPHCWAEISEDGELLHPVGHPAGDHPQPHQDKTKDKTQD